jgi:hypothetical protein
LFAAAVLTAVPDTPKCTDLTKNGDETDVDCGGPICDPCPPTCGEPILAKTNPGCLVANTIAIDLVDGDGQGQFVCITFDAKPVTQASGSCTVTAISLSGDFSGLQGSRFVQELSTCVITIDANDRVTELFLSSNENAVSVALGTGTCGITQTLTMNDGRNVRKRSTESAIVTSLAVLSNVLDGGAQGDPHFTGANGAKFDFDGKPNGDYSLFSAPQVQVNMHLAGDGPATRFMTEIVVVFRNVTIQVGIQYINDRYIDQINAQLAPFGAKAIYRGLQLRLELCPGQSMMISQMLANRKLYPALVHDDGSSFYYLDIAIHTPHCNDEYGGALGQTFKCVFVEGREEFKFDHASEESFRIRALNAVDKTTFSVDAPCNAPPPHNEAQRPLALSGQSTLPRSQRGLFR